MRQLHPNQIPMATSSLESKLLGTDEDKLTPFLLFSCLVASSGGLLFGYDLGISAGVTSSDSFLTQFFPAVSAAVKHDTKISNYCKFDSQLLTLFTSSLYFAGLLASLFSSQLTNRFGCRFSMRAGASFFLAGASVGAASTSLHMLFLSRILLGFGLAFTNQSVPLYLSEMAPASRRGAIFTFFDMCINAGILLANLINYGAQKIEAGWGWRLSLGLAAIPAAFLTAGAFFISDAPKSQQIHHPSRTVVQRNHRPQLLMALALPIFQQLTGINLVTYYAPTMFRSVGLEESASLLSAVITRLTATACNLIAIPLLDRFGRRAFFFLGGIQMLVSQLAVGLIMAVKLGDHGVMSREYAQLMLVFLNVYVAGFGWSWGPLPWLVAEMFPLEMRSEGQSVVVMGGFLFNALMAQSLLSLLCFMKWGIFFFFGGWVLLMTVFVFLFLPETAGVHVQAMGTVWREHWYWRKFEEVNASASI